MTSFLTTASSYHGFFSRVSEVFLNYYKKTGRADVRGLPESVCAWRSGLVEFWRQGRVFTHGLQGVSLTRRPPLNPAGERAAFYGRPSAFTK